MALSDARRRTDGAGLQLWAQPSDARPWRLGYRFGGKQRLLALGVYPTISLARARQAREEARRLLVDGIDPALEKKRRMQEHIDAVTFRAVADEYVTKLKREGRAAATIAKTEWLLGFAHADLGNTPIKAVSAPAVLQVLRGVENRGRFESARRLRSTIGSVFRYAIATARAEVDPTYSLRGALIPGQGGRLLEPQLRIQRRWEPCSVRSMASAVSQALESRSY
jgi:Phage integrase central domain/Arm DNA-binding domain